MRRIVILGGGFAGLTLARALEARDDVRFEVTLVDRQGGCVLTPLLFEVAAGSLAPDRAFRPAGRSLCGTRVLVGEATALDLRRRRVVAAPADGHTPYELPYDDLVIAWGGMATDRGIPGAGRAVPFKTVADALAVRTRALALLDGAHGRPAAVAVIGGGFVGVELATELAAALAHEAKARGLRGDAAPRVALIEAGDRLLAGHSEGLAKAALDGLVARGVDVFLGAEVERITAEAVRLRGGREVPAGLVVLAAGTAPNPLGQAFGLPAGAGGRLAVAATLAVQDTPGVWALGDAAAVPAGDDAPCPPLAQHAVRQAELLAGNLARAATGRPPVPYAWRSPGVIASLGPGDGMAEVAGWTFRGPAVWAARRAYYLATLQDPAGQAGMAADWLAEAWRDPLAPLRGLGPTAITPPAGAAPKAVPPSLRVLWWQDEPAPDAGRRPKP